MSELNSLTFKSYMYEHFRLANTSEANTSEGTSTEIVCVCVCVHVCLSHQVGCPRLLCLRRHGCGQTH